MNKWYQLKIEDALKELGTDAARGLNASETAVRLQVPLAHLPKPSASLHPLCQFQHG
jgi:hypothetical protein